MRDFDAKHLPLSGIHLVEASAGTGKTHAITTLLTRLVYERAVAIDRIVVLTFSEAAAAELKGRIRRRLRAAVNAFAGLPTDDEEMGVLAQNCDNTELALARLRLALRDVDQAPISTIHAFCHRVLREHAFDSGMRLDSELVTDLSALHAEVLEEYWTAQSSEGSSEVVDALMSAELPLSMTKKGEAVVDRPGLVVRGGRSEDADALPRLLDAFAEVKRLWDRSAFEAYLLAAGAVLKGYTDKQVPTWLDKAEVFLSTERPEPAQLPASWKFFCRSEQAHKVKVRQSLADLDEHPICEACERLQDAVSAYVLAQRLVALRVVRGYLDYVKQVWRKRMDASGWMSQGDLITLLDQALQGPSGARFAASLARRYPVALIDEFQDTDRTQYRIFQSVWAGASLFLIGDPKQAIYGFRGAEIFAYLEAARRIDASRRHTMTFNWRSDPGLLHGVETLMTGAEDPFVVDAIKWASVKARPGAVDAYHSPSAGTVGPLQMLFVNQNDVDEHGASERPVLAAVAQHIADALGNGTRIGERALVASDVAVLVPSNDQVAMTVAELHRRGVKAVSYSSLSVYRAGALDAQTLSTVLQAVEQPRQSRLLRAALLSPFVGLRVQQLEALETDEAAWSVWVERFMGYRKLWRDRGVAAMSAALVADAQLEARWLREPDGERRLTNLRHFVELLHTAERAAHLGPAALVEWFDEQRSSEISARGQAHEIRLESDERAVRVMTCHASKGLQFPSVYVPLGWMSRLTSKPKGGVFFHDPDGGDAPTLDLASEPENVERAQFESLAESLRLMYVALTRAKHHCAVVWGPFVSSRKQHFKLSPLGYLLRPPTKARVCKVDDLLASYEGVAEAELRASLAGLVEQSRGAVSVHDLPLGTPVLPTEAPSEPGVSGRPRVVERPIHSRWRVTSFSGLTSRERHGVLPASTEEVREPDERMDASHLAHGDAESTPRSPLADFARGAKAGNFFHAVLERIDFRASTDDEVRGVVNEQLTAYGFSLEAWSTLVTKAMRDIVRTPLSAEGTLSLANLDQDRRELEFHLPVADRTGRAVSASELAEVFRRYPSEALPRSYADAIENLGFHSVEGLLKGYIDLVMRKDDRYFVADYKSNFLGEHLGSYRGADLSSAMVHGHYFLQYHLYAVALHRHLERRLHGYDYERHFGGSYYLFLRGMLPEAGSEFGVFFERPPVERIIALSDLLGGSER